MNTDSPPPPYSQFAMERLKTEGEFYIHYKILYIVSQLKNQLNQAGRLYEYEEKEISIQRQNRRNTKSKETIIKELLSLIYKFSVNFR